MPGRISPGIKFDTPCHVNPLSRLRARSRNRRVVVLVTYFIASVEVRHTIHGRGGDARERERAVLLEYSLPLLWL